MTALGMRPPTLELQTSASTRDAVEARDFFFASAETQRGPKMDGVRFACCWAGSLPPRQEAAVDGLGLCATGDEALP